MISLIVAYDESRVIGCNGKLPWDVPEDLQRFKSLTMGCPVIMGSATYRSIGRQLPGRRNVILTRQPGGLEGLETYPDLEWAIWATREAPVTWVIGGGQIYRQSLKHAKAIYATEVEGTHQGDTYFPALDPEWSKTESIERPGYRFTTWFR